MLSNSLAFEVYFIVQISKMQVYSLYIEINVYMFIYIHTHKYTYWAVYENDWLLNFFPLNL